MMRALLSLILLWPLLAAGVSADAGKPRPLQMGIIPYFNPHAILNTYRPLDQHLEKRLGLEVRTYTAKDFETFIRRTQNGEYDIVITGPNQARLAQKAGYVPLVRYPLDWRIAIVVPVNSQIRNVADLRGKTIAAPDRLALVTMLGKEELRKLGLTPGRDFEFRHSLSLNTAVHMAQRGEAAAALTEIHFFVQMREKLQQELRVLAYLGYKGANNVTYMAHERLGPGRIEQIRQALLDFSGTREGRQFFEKTGFEGFVPATTDELKSMDPYARELERMLEQAP